MNIIVGNKYVHNITKSVAEVVEIELSDTERWIGFRSRGAKSKTLVTESVFKKWYAPYRGKQNKRNRR